VVAAEKTGATNLKQFVDYTKKVDRGAVGSSYETRAFAVFAVPSATPRDIVEKLSDTLIEAGTDDKVKALLANYLIVGPLSFEATNARFKRDTKVPASPSSTRSPQHRDEGRRRTGLDRAKRFEAVAAVERNVARVRGFQVGQGVIAIAPRECVRHQGVAVTLALMCRVDADQRQVPVRFARVVRGHLLDYGRGFLSKGERNRLLDHGTKRFLVGMHPRRQPHRRPGVAVGAEGASVGKCPAAERADQSRHGRKVLVCVRPGPSCHGIRCESQHHGSDGRLFIRCRHHSHCWRFHAAS